MKARLKGVVKPFTVKHLDNGDRWGSDRPTDVECLAQAAAERVISDLPQVARLANWDKGVLGASAATVGLRGCEAAVKRFDGFPGVNPVDPAAEVGVEARQGLAAKRRFLAWSDAPLMRRSR